MKETTRWHLVWLHTQPGPITACCSRSCPLRNAGYRLSAHIFHCLSTGTAKESLFLYLRFPIFQFLSFSSCLSPCISRKDLPSPYLPDTHSCRQQQALPLAFSAQWKANMLPVTSPMSYVLLMSTFLFYQRAQELFSGCWQSIMYIKM